MALFRVLAACLIAALPLAAQRGPQNSRGASFGHIHLNSANPDAAVAFWSDVIGASPDNRGPLKGVSMIGLLILIGQSDAPGPSAGSAIDHIALHVPDLQLFIARLAKTPYKGSQPVPGGDRLIIDGPDGVRIELMEDNTMYAPLEFDHIQLNSAQPSESQAWYAKVFGARKGPADKADKANTSRLMGVNLIFEQKESAAPSAGRGIDHIAFEIKGLEAFCKKLAEEGIQLDSPYKVSTEPRMSSAFLTDPWGTRIGLTEGLGR